MKYPAINAGSFPELRTRDEGPPRLVEEEEERGEYDVLISNVMVRYTVKRDKARPDARGARRRMEFEIPEELEKIIKINISNERLAWYPHFYGKQPIIRTFNYIYKFQRSGIFVAIRQNKVAMFIPFINDKFKNIWGPTIQFEADTQAVELPERFKKFIELYNNAAAAEMGGCSNKYFNSHLKAFSQQPPLERMKEYYAIKSEKLHQQTETFEADITKWYTNANVIDNQIDEKTWGQDSFLITLKDMFITLCEERKNLPDCQFFINRRDYPQMKINRTFETSIFSNGFTLNKNDRNPEDDVLHAGQTQHWLGYVLSAANRRQRQRHGAHCRHRACVRD